MTLVLIHSAILVLVAIAALGVVLTRDPRGQAIAVSAYGVVLALMFLAYRAPDVALSQIVVGAVALPLMIVLSLASIRRAEEKKR